MVVNKKEQFIIKWRLKIFKMLKSEFIFSTMFISMYTILLFLFFWFLGLGLNLRTFIGAFCVYLIYQEVMGDLKEYALLRAGKK